MKTLLIVESNLFDTEKIKEHFLRRMGELSIPARIVMARAFDEVENLVVRENPDIVSTEMVLPRTYGEVVGNQTGRFVVSLINRISPKTPVFLITRSTDIGTHSRWIPRELIFCKPDEYERCAERMGEFLFQTPT